jgi:signal transduction histidine kinase
LVGLWPLAVVLGVSSVAVSWAAPAYSLFADRWQGAEMLLLAGWSATAAGLVLWRRHPGNRCGPLMVAAGVAWFASQWDSPGTRTGGAVLAATLFTTGLALAAAAPACVAHCALAYPGGHLGSWPSRICASTGHLSAVGILGIGASAFFDPVAQGCACPTNGWLVRGDPAVAAAVSRVGLATGAAWALSTTLLLGARYLRASPAVRLVTAQVSAAAAAVLVVSGAWYTHSLGRGFIGTTQGDQRFWLAQAATLTALAAALAWGLLRSRRVRASLARIVAKPQAGSVQQLRADLRDLLGDPDLVIAYPMGDGSYVDGEAHPVDVPPARDKVATEIPVAGSTAVLIHRPGALDSPVLIDELTSAAQLALNNDRLRTHAMVQLTDLRTSQIRIVETGDAERRRMERDLHDGAQQRLVGILLAIRLLRAQPGAHGGALAEAEAALGLAIDDLRDVAHGLFPSVLRDEGLTAAVHALAETHYVSVEAPSGRRWPAVLETTAYLVVARAVAIGPVGVVIAADSKGLDLTIDLSAIVDDLVDFRDLDDRVQAVGGSLDRSEPSPGVARIRLRIGGDSAPPADLPATHERGRRRLP